MKNDKSERRQSGSEAITEEDFKEFLSATGEKQWEILLAHAEKNKKIVQAKNGETDGEGSAQ